MTNQSNDLPVDGENPLIDGHDNDDDSVTKNPLISKIVEANDDDNDSNAVNNINDDGGVPIISKIVVTNDDVRGIEDGNDDCPVVNMIIDADDGNPGHYNGSLGDVFVISEADNNGDDEFRKFENSYNNAEGAHIDNNVPRPCNKFADEFGGFADGDSDADGNDPDAFEPGDDGGNGNFASNTAGADKFITFKDDSDGGNGNFMSDTVDADKFDGIKGEFDTSKNNGDGENDNFASATDTNLRGNGEGITTTTKLAWEIEKFDTVLVSSINTCDLA